MAEAEATFFYDLGSPDCYLTAERLRAELPVICEWAPVHAAALHLTAPAPDRTALAEAVAQQGLLPLRMGAAWPPDTELAMRVATYAGGAGKSIAYSLAAFRQAFAGGRELGDETTVMLAAAACEMHPAAVLRGAALRSVAQRLAQTGERARAAGVAALPAIRLGDGPTFCGAEALEGAIAALER